MSREFKIGKKYVGLDHPTYFIADIAANHDGDIERAKDLIALVAENGGNAVKFQNFLAESIVSDFGFKNLGSQQSHQENWEKSVFETYKDASLPLEWTRTLKETADNCGVDYITSPYDISIITELSQYVCAWKLGSGDITWLEEIEILAKNCKPLRIATGAANMEEVRVAVDLAATHCDNIVVMCNRNIGV